MAHFTADSVTSISKGKTPDYPHQSFFQQDETRVLSFYTGPTA
jgi:hypothetical protein